MLPEFNRLMFQADKLECAGFIREARELRARAVAMMESR